jgi:gas vesicle protein
MRRLASFLTGAIIGGLVGATFALLFAPATGGELQGRLRLRAAEFQKEIWSAAQSKREELQKQLEILRKPE